ncbi:MAG: TonB family protein [Burkholderiales bacterium]|nr:TonB family protein [Burkholderiales bacterium]
MSSYAYPSGRPATGARLQFRLLPRLLPIAAIVAAHLALFYALQHGLLTKAVRLPPKEVMLTLVQSVQTPPPRQSIAPKHMVPLQVEMPAPPEIAVAIPPAEHSIAAAPPAPQSASKTEPLAGVSPPGSPPALPKQVSAVEYLQAPQADYPPLSRRMGEEGKVTLRVLVNEKGHAEKVDIQKSSGSNRLDEAARAALLRAVFKPYLEDGKALTIVATATISFALNS